MNDFAATDAYLDAGGGDCVEGRAGGNTGTESRTTK